MPSHGLLFTGDTFYEGTVWLFVPETSLSSYAASVDRLAALVPRLKKVLPAHNGASASPERLTELRAAVAAVRARPESGQVTGEGQVTFSFPHFSILTSRKALDGLERARRTGRLGALGAEPGAARPRHAALLNGIRPGGTRCTSRSRPPPASRRAARPRRRPCPSPRPRRPR